MPTWLSWALLALFSVHALGFGVAFSRRRLTRYALLTLTFALLVLSFCVRLWRPELTLGGIGASWWPRFAAWVCGVAALTLLLRDRRRRRRRRHPGDDLP